MGYREYILGIKRFLEFDKVKSVFLFLDWKRAFLFIEFNNANYWPENNQNLYYFYHLLESFLQ
jgi:hypothetical protein